MEVNKNDFLRRLRALGAEDRGEVLLEEIIFHDAAGTWSDGGKFVRLRKSCGKIMLTYKHHEKQAIDGAREIELEVDDIRKAEAFLVAIGLQAARHQQKYRHTFVLDGVTLDIDTWPKIPTYVELEGESEAAIRACAEKLGFDWSQAVFEDARAIIENRYHIPLRTMHWFTFEKFE